MCPVLVTGTGPRGPLRIEIKRVGENSFAERKGLLKRKLDAQREHTPKQNGCGFLRFTGTAGL